jgi:AbrB family looped-hinge helix DNA binding protein
MKATGIVRRIDDLGRVVIPKEIRRTMRIREGDPLLTTLIDPSRPLSISFNEISPVDKEELFINGMISILARLGFNEQ